MSHGFTTWLIPQFPRLYIADQETGKEFWDSLKKYFHVLDEVYVQKLTKKLVRCDQELVSV